MKKLAIAFAAVAAISAPAMAAPGNSSSASGNANAKVVGPITIKHDIGASLNFGAFTADTTDSGTITVDQNGTGGVAGGVNELDDGNTASADSFTVTGAPGRSFSISATGGILTRTGGSETMSFTVNAPTSGTMPATAGDPATLTVGGTLTVPANQAPGDYTGSYSLTVTYS